MTWTGEEGGGYEETLVLGSGTGQPPEAEHIVDVA